MMEWKTIETAPEGEPIIVWVPGANRGIDSAEVVIIVPDPGGISFWTNGGPNGGSDMYFDKQPTYWMPLPPPPTEGTKP